MDPAWCRSAWVGATSSGSAWFSVCLIGGRHGFFQPNISMPGLVPPGAYPPGLVQTGAYPGGLIQPGAYPRGFMQPGADQQGLVQPVIDPHWGRQSGTGRSIIPPGTELRVSNIPCRFSKFYITTPHTSKVWHLAGISMVRYHHSYSSQGLTPSGTDREALVLREMYRNKVCSSVGPRH